jgi:hypothetical protein
MERKMAKKIISTFGKKKQGGLFIFKGYGYLFNVLLYNVGCVHRYSYL